jgi:putative ABC transport system ATP-binding protein
MAILSLSQITKNYRKGDIEVKALAGVDMELEKGEFCAIVGPSGSGKTTLLNIIGCLDKPTSGIISYQGRELKVMGEKELSAYRREHVSFIFQSFNLIPVLTVVENVELPLSIDGSFSKAAMRKKALEILDAVGIADKADRYPRELSGGQEQRVAIARALIKEPSVVLADEPTANLDSHNAEEIIRLMKLMNQKSNTTFIFSTHDKMIMEEALRVFHLHDGLIVKDERKQK